MNNFTVLISNLNRITAFCLILILFSINSFGQCTLTAGSVTQNNVSCNGLSDGSVTLNVSGAQGAVTYSNGSGNVMLQTQQFNSSVISHSSSGPTGVWWSPGTCIDGSEFVYSSPKPVRICNPDLLSRGFIIPLLIL